jgi:hypothetical protein
VHLRCLCPAVSLVRLCACPGAVSFEVHQDLGAGCDRGGDLDDALDAVTSGVGERIRMSLRFHVLLPHFLRAVVLRWLAGREEIIGGRSNNVSCSSGVFAWTPGFAGLERRLG